MRKVMFYFLDKYERIHPVIGRKSFVVKMQDKVGVVMKDGEQIIPFASMIRFLHGGNMGLLRIML